MHTEFWSGALRERDHMEDLGLDGRDNIKMVLQEVWWRDVYWIDLA